MIKAPVPGIQIQVHCLIKPWLRSSHLRGHTKISEEVRVKTLILFPLEDLLLMVAESPSSIETVSYLTTQVRTCARVVMVSSRSPCAQLPVPRACLPTARNKALVSHQLEGSGWRHPRNSEQAAWSLPAGLQGRPKTGRATIHRHVMAHSIRRSKTSWESFALTSPRRRKSR